MRDAIRCSITNYFARMRRAHVWGSNPAESVAFQL